MWGIQNEYLVKGQYRIQTMKQTKIKQKLSYIYFEITNVSKYYSFVTGL